MMLKIVSDVCLQFLFQVLGIADSETFVITTTNREEIRDDNTFRKPIYIAVYEISKTMLPLGPVENLLALPHVALDIRPQFFLFAGVHHTFRNFKVGRSENNKN